MAQTLIQRSRGKSALEKATFHQFDGKVLRKFFGLSPADETAIETDVGVKLQVNLDTEGSRSA